MFRLIFFLIVSYFVFKGLDFLWRLFLNYNRNKANRNNVPPSNSKYKDVEEAEFTEIKDDEDKKLK